MAEKIQQDFTQVAVAKGLLPTEAHRMPDIVSLTAPSDASKPLRFWQLYSGLGQDPIVGIIGKGAGLVTFDETPCLRQP
ncbi:hypothetical protein [Yoonia sediminilitoris]|uniref:hypothetical protein n=1 Tax=Yoonia sediminilitoris TaxID=1286148 RepID=UPI000D381D34|nr:hypothetical protein [Yoonia sediminilitoris]